MRKNPWILVACIAGAYGVTGFLLYRQRVRSGATLWDSDLLVVALPMIIAFLAFAWVLWPETSKNQGVWSRVRAVGLAAVATIVSQGAYMTVAFNQYGT